MNYVTSASLDITLTVSSSERRRVVLLMGHVQISPCGFDCKCEESWCYQINFQFEIGPFWDSNHENVHCIFLTFLENKRFFARTLFTSDYLSTLKLSMDKNEGNRFLNSWCSIFPDRCSLSLEVIFLALLPTWGENLLCLLKKAQQREQQKSLFFLNSTFYRSAWAWRVFMIFNNSSRRKL